MAAGRAIQDVDDARRATSRARSTKTRPNSRCDDGFASKIEPADTDKDAFIVAHQGAAEYINDDTKSFMDRYSDMMYLGAAALSVIGSIFAAIYTKIPGSRRRRPANWRPPFSTSASGSNTPIRWMRSTRCRTNSKPSCAAR